MKEVYRLTKNELFEKFGSREGLTEEQAEKRFYEYGENVLREDGKKSVFSIFLSQFADLLVIILIIAAVISMVSGNVESTVVILVVIILNAVLGTVQYVKAEKSLDSLKELSSPKTKVLRDGIKKEVASKEIVPGDIIILEAGDMVVADGRIIENYSLQVNESSLTGESTNVDKKDMDMEEKTALGDRCNMVFSGSLVTYGRADILVTSTGMNTEMGKIASLMNDTKNKKTPLQVSLDDFSKKLALVIMVISIIVFGLRIWQGETVLDSLIFAVALAVAAIPEALSSIVTIVQAMGTGRMAADNAVIKDLKAVESLGCVSVICSDKTGTLTQNKMTVREIYVDGKCILPEELKLTSGVHRYLLYNAILNNDSCIADGKNIGDPTEICLLEMARKAGLKGDGMCEEDLRKFMVRMEELPFDSDRKLMSTKYLIHGIPTVLTKGAVDVLIDRIDSIASDEGVHPVTKEDVDNILRQNENFSKKGLRVLAFVYKECDENDILSPEKECGYTFIGLVSMIDPPREESVEAVGAAANAGIKTVMITGDHKDTAIAIAEQIGIYHDGDIALTGQELDEMSDAGLEDTIEKVSVYARVSPENKIRIVDAWQRRGNIVAMTGDGVNDAPALKKSDIGVAMGITGTEVSKDASAMILTDDNFATIIKAVLNGRNVYRNIMNAIQFLLSGNMAAILVVIYCSFMALPTPFEPVHLLFINLLTDSLPALAIGMEPSDKDLLNNKPRNPKTGIFTRTFSCHLMVYGILIASVTLLAYYQGLKISTMTASTMAFATLTLARLFHGFNCRSKQSVFKIGLMSNRWSIYAFVTGIILLFLVLFIPLMQGLFSVAVLSGKQIGEIIIFAIIPAIIIQLYKIIKYK
ncbi:MAG: cation-translocating P-type ATPase [Eubacteriales bacterium]|nr:cation-translocating P-type ATPase [Eubacteriales bacterium]